MIIKNKLKSTIVTMHPLLIKNDPEKGHFLFTSE
jgi:hypothetical protein